MELEERFEDMRLVGKGSFADVFVAKDRILGREVALKAYRRSPSDLAKLTKTLAVIAELRHPNITQVFDILNRENLPVIVQTFCENGSLRERLTSQPIPTSDAIRMFTGIADGVAFLHGHKLLHADLKLENIMLDALGEPVLIDFDQCKPMYDESPWVSNGTPVYLAPELTSGSPSPSIATEVYALGVLLFELLSGKPLSGGIAMTRRIERLALPKNSIPNRLDWNAIIAMATHSVPSQRYASVQAFRHDVERLTKSLPVTARKVSRTERLALIVRRFPTTSIMIAAMALLMAIGMAISMLAWRAAVAQQRIAESKVKHLEEQIKLTSAAQSKLNETKSKKEEQNRLANHAKEVQEKRTLEARLAQERLNSEALRAEQLAMAATESLRKVRESLGLLNATKAQRETAQVELGRIQNASAKLKIHTDYCVCVRQVWNAIESRSWKEAEQKLNNLDGKMRGVEFAMLEDCIRARMLEPKRIRLGSVRDFTGLIAGRLKVTGENAGNEHIVLLDHEYARSLSLLDGKIRLRPDISSLKLSYLDIDVSETLRNSDGGLVDWIGLSVLTDGSLIVVKPTVSAQSKIASAYSEVYAYTFRPDQFSQVNDGLSAEQVSLLAEARLKTVEESFGIRTIQWRSDVRDNYLGKVDCEFRSVSPKQQLPAGTRLFAMGKDSELVYLHPTLDRCVLTNLARQEYLELPLSREQCEGGIAFDIQGNLIATASNGRLITRIPRKGNMEFDAPESLDLATLATSGQVVHLGLGFQQNFFRSVFDVSESKKLNRIRIESFSLSMEPQEPNPLLAIQFGGSQPKAAAGTRRRGLIHSGQMIALSPDRFLVQVESANRLLQTYLIDNGAGGFFFCDTRRIGPYAKSADGEAIVCLDPDNTLVEFKLSLP